MPKITKDIGCQYDQKEPLTKEEEDQAVDEAFAAADQTMNSQNDAFEYRGQLRQRKSFHIKRFVLSIVIFFLIIIMTTIGVGIYSVSKMIPELKNNVTQELIAMKNEATEDMTGDSKEEQFLKDVFSVLTDEDIETIVDQINFKSLLQALSNGSNIPIDYTVLSEETQQKIEIIKEKYSNLADEQDATETTTDPNAETSATETTAPQNQDATSTTEDAIETEQTQNIQ